MRTDALLNETARLAQEYLDRLASDSISPAASVEALRAALHRPCPERGTPALAVIQELVRDANDGLLKSSSGRFYGWVIGGTLPAALAADWLTATWDQNAAIHACSPAASVVEEVCGQWLKELLGLPHKASFALVTGCQMAHTTALAAARHQLLADRNWDVEAQGLAGSPPIRILTSGERHESILRAVRLLGIGTAAIELTASDDAGCLDVDDLSRRLAQHPDAPTIVCLQAGSIHRGAFDPFGPACAVAHRHNAWVHVDGAFGLWVRASKRFRHLAADVDQADSWATDGHKWLNVPFDTGYVFVAHPTAHRAA
ncbi:MAG: aminotransferase class V-fold PLP-dependent enzyme, partial [Gammaproteobacteria bacterium]|nr:aminotransferase class V-fold PLP-dependent enzyme [Gammaproteobacteria bacterium]